MASSSAGDAVLGGTVARSPSRSRRKRRTTGKSHAARTTRSRSGTARTRIPRWRASPAAPRRAGPQQSGAAGWPARVPSAPRTRPLRRRRRGCRTARRNGSPARTRSSRCRTAARRARRSCRARDRSRRAAPPARGARAAARGSLVFLGQAVDESLEIVRGAASRVRTPAHEEARRSPHADLLPFLHARVQSRGVALAVHARVVLVEVQPNGLGEVAEQRARVLPRLGPLVVVEQLVVHLPELALLAGDRKSTRLNSSH